MDKVVIVEYIDGVTKTHKNADRAPTVKDGVYVKINKFKGEDIIIPLLNIRDIRTLNKTDYDKEQAGNTSSGGLSHK